MKRHSLSFVMMLVGALAGCGTNDTSGQTDKCLNVMCPSGQTCSASSGLCEGTIDKCTGVTCTFPQGCDASTGMCANPQMPSTTGALMDRMGRPAVNTALTNPFDLYKPQGATETDGVTKDRYNKDGTVAYEPQRGTCYSEVIRITEDPRRGSGSGRERIKSRRCLS